MEPSKTSKYHIPVYFKKPNTPPASKKARTEEGNMKDTTIGYQNEDLDDDFSLQDTQPDTVGLHPTQPQLTSLDIGTTSSSSQLDLDAELCPEFASLENNAADQVSLTGELYTQPDAVDLPPVQSQLNDLNAEDSSTVSS